MAILIAQNRNTPISPDQSAIATRYKDQDVRPPATVAPGYSSAVSHLLPHTSKLLCSESLHTLASPFSFAARLRCRRFPKPYQVSSALLHPLPVHTHDTLAKTCSSKANRLHILKVYSCTATSDVVPLIPTVEENNNINLVPADTLFQHIFCIDAV